MEKNALFSADGIARQFQASVSAALVSGAAMAVPVTIFLAGFWTSGLFLTEHAKPTVALVCTIVLTLFFPLVMVTFSTITKMEAVVAHVKESIKFDGLTHDRCRLFQAYQ